MRIYFLIIVLCFTSLDALSTEPTEEFACVDHPSEIIKNGGKCKLHAEKTGTMNAAIYNAINLCLIESKQFEFNEFITDWNLKSSSAKVSIYESNESYFFSFNIDGDVGGGFGCLYEKSGKKIRWIEPYY